MTDIRFTVEHEWVALDGDTATVGITDYAQNLLGDLVFIQLPDVGASVRKGAEAGVVESVKAASDIFAPLTGTITEVNPTTVDNPAVVNTDPMGQGWLFKMTFEDRAEFEALLTESAYRQTTP